MKPSSGLAGNIRKLYERMPASSSSNNLHLVGTNEYQLMDLLLPRLLDTESIAMPCRTVQLRRHARAPSGRHRRLHITILYNLHSYGCYLSLKAALRFLVDGLLQKLPLYNRARFVPQIDVNIDISTSLYLLPYCRAARSTNVYCICQRAL
jgi:hypothetical protein